MKMSDERCQGIVLGSDTGLANGRSYMVNNPSRMRLGPLWERYIADPFLHKLKEDFYVPMRMFNVC